MFQIFTPTFKDVRRCQLLPNFTSIFNITKPWGNHYVDNDTRHLYMNEQQWQNLVQNITARSRSDPLKARFYIARLQQDRDRFKPKPNSKYIHQPKPHENLYKLYMDMIEEPEKYPAEDLAKLEEYEAILNKTSFKNDIDQYWNNRYHQEVIVPRELAAFKIQQEIERQEKQRQDEEALRIWAYFDGYATKIQALVRGHQERCRYPNRWTDCAHCLAHRVCKHQIGWRYWICDDCHNEINV